MIVRGLDEKKGIAILIPEGLEDLITLRRIVNKGCYVKADTTRLVKPRGEYQRPDRGERVKVKITLEVEKVKLDGSLGKLRVLGKVIESSSELVERGCHHSISITPGDVIGLRKEGLDPMLLGEREEGFVLVAIDYRSGGVGLLVGSSLKTIQEVRSEMGGKMYRSREVIGRYLEDVVKLVRDFCKDCKVVVSGPFDVKLELAKRLREIGYEVRILEGLDVSGRDGVMLMLGSEQFRKAVKGCKMAEVARVIDEFSRRLYKSSETVALGFEEVSRASEFGAVKSLIISDEAFRFIEESGFIDLIDLVEKMGGKVYLVDGSTSQGKQVSLNGGLIALLRYPIRRKTI